MQREYNKCPACGEIRKAFSAQCPSCGYDFQNACAKVVEELNAKFEVVALDDYTNSEREKLQLELIKSFTIPQIKEELLDLLMYIQPKATVKNETKVTVEWRLRQKEVINRAKMAFANDRKILEKIQSYEDELKKLEKQHFRKWWQKTSILTKIAIAVVLLFILILIIPAKDNSPETYSVKFAEAVENKEYDKAMDYLSEVPSMGRIISDQYLTLIDGLIEEGRVVEAENLYNNLNSFVNRSENANHLSKTCDNFIKYYVDKGNIDKAGKFATEVDGIATVLKNIILSGDTNAAIKYYKRNSHKLTKYDSKQRKRVLMCNDEIVENFIYDNNLLK
ncbi:MAG: hypothetical protein IKW46_10850 [Bacteroidaceae bacterium]|nr:hypothetical protein [Bacteroidaceae bacterium]